ncbi:MAG: hypothetical protein U1E73_04065 [Planctomycetota bacterium]
MNKVLPVIAGAFAAALPAQNRSVIPAACTQLPGNAALSMPLRWSQGTMQVRIDAQLLPANFIGRQITGIRLRRPSFLDEPAYGAVQRTLTVRADFDPRPANAMTQSRLGNAPGQGSTLTTVFGPAVVNVAATPATGPSTATGDEFLVIPFLQPLTVLAGGLFLEFEAGDAPMNVLPDNWVDAVWFDNGVETGYAVTVGDGSCTTRAVPTRLLWNGSSGPRVGGNLSLSLTGAAPSVFVLAWIGFDPVPRAAGPFYVGYGASVGALDPALGSCFQWAPTDVSWLARAGTYGSYTTQFAMPNGIFAVGSKVGCQAAWLDTSRPGLPLSISNGVQLVLDNIGVQARCATAFFPGAAAWSPWAPYIGQMPVVVLEHN